MTGQRGGKRHAMLLTLATACLSGQRSTLYCTSQEDAARWRTELAVLLPDDVTADLVTYTWPGMPERLRGAPGWVRRRWFEGSGHRRTYGG